MDASSPTAVRRAPVVQLKQKPESIDLAQRARVALQVRDAARQAQVVAEAFKRGREVACTEHWVTGAKVGMACGFVLGAATAAVLFRIFTALGFAG